MTRDKRRGYAIWFAVAPAMVLLCSCTKPASRGTRSEPKTLSELSLSRSTFGKGWRKSTGVVLENWDDLQKLPAEARATLEPVSEQYQSLGIVAMGDYSVVRTAPRVNTVSVRVFVFRDPDSCLAWREKKYQYDGWEKHYKRVADVGCFTLDSTQLNKRIVMVDRYWLTAHQAGSDSKHVTALKSIMKQLKLSP